MADDLRLLNLRIGADPDVIYDFEQDLYATNFGTGLVLQVKPTIDSGLIRNTDKNFANRLFSSSVAAVEHGNGLSIEEASVNQFHRSEEFNQVYWTKTGSVVSPNDQIAPNGNFVANLLEDDDLGGAPKIVGFERAITLPTTGDWVISIYVKDVSTVNWFSIETADYDMTQTTWFNVQTGVIGTQNHPDAGVEHVDNGWLRIWIRFTTTDLIGTIRFAMADVDTGTTLATIDGAQTIHIYGAQLENKSKPTTYIFTLGSIMARDKDSLILVPLNITSGVGTGYIRYRAGEQVNDGNTRHLFSMGDGTAGNSFNRIYIRNSSVYMNVSGTERLLSRNDGVNPNEVIEIMWRWGLTSDLGIAAKYGTQDGNIVTFIISENTNISVPGGLGTLGVGIGIRYDDVNGGQPSGEILQVALWSTAKTDIEINSIIFQPPPPPPISETIFIDTASLTLTSLFVVVDPLLIDLVTLTLDSSFNIEVGHILVPLSTLTLTGFILLQPVTDLDGGDAVQSGVTSTEDGGDAVQSGIIGTYDGGDSTT